MATKEINIEITTDNSNNNNIQKKQIEDTNIIGKDDKVDNGNLIKDNAIEKFPWIPVLVNSLVIVFGFTINCYLLNFCENF